MSVCPFVIRYIGNGMTIFKNSFTIRIANIGSEKILEDMRPVLISLSPIDSKSVHYQKYFNQFGISFEYSDADIIHTLFSENHNHEFSSICEEIMNISAAYHLGF